MSPTRESVGEPVPSATVWKASKHRLVGESPHSEYVEATPGAAWARTEPFGTYRPAGERGAWSEPTPLEHFSKLADLAEDWTEKGTKLFRQAVRVFADRYGLLGLFREEFGAPLLPERELDPFVCRVAPDTVVERDGRLRWIEPATEGKRLVERELVRDWELDWKAPLFEEPPDPTNYFEAPLDATVLLLPSELRFRRRITDFEVEGFSRPLPDFEPGRVFAYEEIQRQYGLRVVYDPGKLLTTSVFLLSTREPVNMWRRKLSVFARPPDQRVLNGHLEDVRPLLVFGDDGRPASSWSCPSMLKALHLMRYLDLVAGVRVQRCQAPGCREYFRVGPRSSRSRYCPPEPGRKQSACASRASSAMYRERQRQKS
jgi:hypothetical protein